MNAAAESSSAHPHYLALVVIASVCFVGYLLYVFLKARDRLPWTQTLVSTPTFLRDPYARAQDIRHLLARSPRPGRITYARTGSRQYLQTPDEHSLLVIGGAGSRKTSSILAPAARAWVGPAVLVCTKPDLMAQTARTRPNPLLFEPGAVESFPPLVGWSPLDAIRDALRDHSLEQGWTEAIRTAVAMTTSSARVGADDFWMAAAAQTLAPLLLAASLASGADVPSLIAWVRQRDFAAPLALLQSHQPPEQAASALTDLSTKDERIRSRIMTSLGVAIRAYDDPRVLAAATMRNRFRPSMLLDPNHPATTLYLLGDSLTQEWLTPVFVGLLDELTRAWYARSDELMRQQRGDPDERVTPPEQRLLLVLDDAVDLAPLANLDKLAATGGSHGVSVVLGLQDLSWLRRRFGEPMADSVVNSFQTRVLTHGMGDAPTLRLINELIGQTEVQTTAVTTVDGLARSSQSTASRDILTTAELRELSPGRAIVISGTERPIHAYLLDRSEFVDAQSVDEDVIMAGANPAPPPERRWPFQPRTADPRRDE